MSCFNKASYRKCVAMRDSAVLYYLQVCYFGAIFWQEPKLLAGCLWWSSQLQYFPEATRPLDPVQFFSLMKIKIDSPYFWVCVCNQCNWTGAVFPGCHCLSPCLLSWLHLTSTSEFTSLGWRSCSASPFITSVFLHRLYMRRVYLHSISSFCCFWRGVVVGGEYTRPGLRGKQHSCDGLRLGSQLAEWHGCASHRGIVGSTVTLWKLQLTEVSYYCMVRMGGFWTSKETASQRLWVDRATSLVHLLCISLLCSQLSLFFSTKPCKANRLQVKSWAGFCFCCFWTPVLPPTGLCCHVWRHPTCVKPEDLIPPLQARAGAEQDF